MINSNNNSNNKSFQTRGPYNRHNQTTHEHKIMVSRNILPWVAEPFSKWGAQVHVKKLYKMIVV